MFDQDRRGAVDGGTIVHDLRGPMSRKEPSHMHSPPRLRRPRALAAVVAAIAIAFATAGPAAADAPNAHGAANGGAQAAPVTPAYDAPKPAGAGTGRKIG
jgi:hypothetical protein